MTLLVDTGASTVVLKPADAERAGIDTTKLSYTVAVDTANGTTYAAPVRLRPSPSAPSSCTTSMPSSRSPEALRKTCSV